MMVFVFPNEQQLQKRDTVRFYVLSVCVAPRLHAEQGSSMLLIS